MPQAKINVTASASDTLIAGVAPLVSVEMLPPSFTTFSCASTFKPFPPNASRIVIVSPSTVFV